ncbi:hypothetical protein DSUL_50087 [Desulfovibrionales bacterium]
MMSGGGCPGWSNVQRLGQCQLFSRSRLQTDDILRFRCPPSDAFDCIGMAVDKGQYEGHLVTKFYTALVT